MRQSLHADRNMDKARARGGRGEGKTESVAQTRVFRGEEVSFGQHQPIIYHIYHGVV